MSSVRLNSPSRLYGDARIIGLAKTIDHFEFCFSVWSKMNNCATADIIPGGVSNIFGVVYAIPDFLIKRDTAGKRKSLDSIEGEGGNYRRIYIDVTGQNEEILNENVITYVARHSKESLKTSLNYVKHIISGLCEHKAPQEYLTYVIYRIINNNPVLESDIITYAKSLGIDRAF